MNQEKMGKFISKLRKERKLTQQELADRLVVDRTSVSKWENGINVPSYEILIEMQKLFNVTINEILYGERKNDNNNEQIDAVPINIMNQSNRKIKKITLISTTIVLLITFVFFIYYFMTNYNSIRIYKITATENNISISNGIMIVSREKSYIRVGDVDYKGDIPIKDIRLFFLKGKETFDIFVTGVSNAKSLFTNEFNYSELFKYSDLKYIINNLYLELMFENGDSYTLKLNVKKDFSNNTIFNTKNIDFIQDAEPSKKIDEIPKYIVDNFEYDSEQEKYSRVTYLDGYSIIESYYSIEKTYSVIFIFDNYTEYYTYTFSDNFLNYYVLKDTNMIEKYTYDYTKNSCFDGKCDIKKINNFTNKFLNFLLN